MSFTFGAPVLLALACGLGLGGAVFRAEVEENQIAFVVGADGSLASSSGGPSSKLSTHYDTYDYDYDVGADYFVAESSGLGVAAKTSLLCENWPSTNFACSSEGNFTRLDGTASTKESCRTLCLTSSTQSLCCLWMRTQGCFMKVGAKAIAIRTSGSFAMNCQPVERVGSQLPFRQDRVEPVGSMTATDIAEEIAAIRRNISAIRGNISAIRAERLQK